MTFKALFYRGSAQSNHSYFQVYDTTYTVNIHTNLEYNRHDIDQFGLNYKSLAFLNST